MNKFPTRRSHQGFSLLEVLVAVVILSVGLLALASLQISLMRSSTDSKARTVALSLAKERLENLRTFTSLTGYQNLADSGTQPPVTIGGISYTPAWTVERFIYNEDVDGDGTLNEANDQQFQGPVSPDTGATPGSPAGYVDNNEFKRIKVTVDWTDAEAGNQRVAMEDAVAALSPSDGALIAKQGQVNATRKIPAIINDPALDNMVIPIALGGGVNSAASNPKPQVVKGTSTVETQFDVYTYANLSGGTALAQARVETVMVGCTCDFSTGGAAHNMRPTYWDGVRYTVPLAAEYTSPAGQASAYVDLQSERCSICCRDHHDPADVTGATFSPRLVAKNSSDTVTTQHPHFADKTSSTPITSGIYKEACRLIRVDGIWRVAADIENDYFAMLATGNGTTALTPNPDTTTTLGNPAISGGAFARYQQFVLAYLKSRYIPTTQPSDAAAQGVYNTVGSPATLAGSTTYELNQPTSIDMDLVDNNAATGGKWLHSRGLYIDYLETEAVEAIKQARIDISCSADAASLQTCVFKLLPFTSINLTEIADWEPAEASFQVTNLDYSGALAAGNPVRGHALSNASVATTKIATTKSRKYNTGLLDLNGGFDAIGLADATFLTDTQTFALGGGSQTSGPGDGSIIVTKGTYPSAGVLSVSTYISTAPSTTTTSPCNGTSPTYPCPINGLDDGAGTALSGLGVAGSIALDVGGYNHETTVSGTTTPVLTCTGTGNATGLTRTTAGYSYTAKKCTNYAVSSVTAPSGAGTVSWSEISPTSPRSAGNGRIFPLPGEVTRINFTGSFADGDNVTVNFVQETAPTDPIGTPTCTFICSPPGQLNAAGDDCKGNSLPPIFTITFPACQ
jgi:prepilin-type N-terminal cleavage/methylation domain-containing protein